MNALAELEMFYRMSVEDAVKKLSFLLNPPKAKHDREGKNRRVGKVLSPESAQIRDERFIGGTRIRWRGDVGECPERTWITPVSGVGERRLEVEKGNRRGVQILYKGVTYISIAAASRSLGTTRYAIKCGLGMRVRK